MLGDLTPVRQLACTSRWVMEDEIGFYEEKVIKESGVKLFKMQISCEIVVYVGKCCHNVAIMSNILWSEDKLLRSSLVKTKYVQFYFWGDLGSMRSLCLICVFPATESALRLSTVQNKPQDDSQPPKTGPTSLQIHLFNCTLYYVNFQHFTGLLKAVAT